MIDKEYVDLIKQDNAENNYVQQYMPDNGEESICKDNNAAPEDNPGKRTAAASSHKKAAIIAIPIILLILIGYSFYILNLEKYIDNQNTLVFGQNEFEPGSEAGLRIVAQNHKDSEPITGASVTIALRDKDTNQKTFLFEGKTEEQGTQDIKFMIPENLEGEYELIITAKSKYGSDEIIKPVKIEKIYKLLLTTDKPMYQPGQTMHIRALSLENSDSSPAENKEVTIEVEDSKGNKVYKKKIKTSEYGIVGTDFTLADEINYGRYTIKASIGDYSAEKKVEVKKYVLPKFKVSLDTDRSYYLPGQKLTGTVNADYFFGKATNDAQVDVKIYTYEVNLEEIGNFHGTTGSDGIYRFEFDLPSHFVGLPLEKGSGLIFFNISVTDQAMHKEEMSSSVPIAKDSIEIELIPESGMLEKGLENIIYVMTTYPDGKPSQCTVTIKGQEIQTNSYGLGEFKITPDNFVIKMEAVAQDSSGNRGSAEIQLPRDYVASPRTEEEWRRNQRYSRDMSRTESVLLRVDKSILDVGDTLHLDTFYTGSAGTVYIDVIKDKQTILTKALDVRNGRASLDIDLDETMAGMIELHAYKILRNSDIVRDTRSIFVNQKNDISLDISTGKDTYLPGEEAEITFRTTRDNAAIPAAIGVNIVDESVFALQEKESGFERLYFELEEELMKPRYTIYGITLPGLIYETQHPVDDLIKRQAGNILMAEARDTDRFSLKATSRVEKEQEIQKKKSDYFENLFKFTKLLLILMPILILAQAAYRSRNQKKIMLKNIALSVLLIIGTVLLTIIIFWIMAMTANIFGHQQRETVNIIQMLILTITLISSIILSIWSRKNDYFRTYMISTMSIPIQLVLIFVSLSAVAGYMYSELIFLAVPVLILLAIIYSSVRMIKYSKDNDTDLFWITIHLIIYILAFSAFIFSASTGSGLFRDMEDVLWIVLSALIIPIIYGTHAVEFIRAKNVQAIPAFIISFAFIIMSLALVIMIISSSTMRFAGNADMMVMKNVAFDRGMERMTAESGTGRIPNPPAPEDTPSGEMPRVRQFFPETLYSNPEIITDDGGKATISLNMADSITSWRITALANSLKGDIGSGNAAMTVFQDFFVDIDLPVSLTQGDEVSIPVSVFNYLKTHQSVRLELQGESWFELLDESTKTLDIAANDIDVVYFRLKARKLGNHKLTIFAYGNEKSDAISRIIEIIPDGKEFRESHSDRLEGIVEKTIRVPQEAIDDSERLFVKIYPGIFSQVVEGLDSMFTMPSGCFEQTSSTTYPNILALDYMKKTGQINPEIQFKAEGYIGTGYQRLMSFESNTPGGWTWFGPPEEANLMLSAYGLIEFSDMAKVYEIDDTIVKRTQEYIISQMNQDGSFEPKGRLHTSGLEVQSDKMTSTCFVAWSLAYTDYSSMQKTADYITENIDLKNENTYTLALCANAIAHYNKEKSLPILEELNSRATKDEKTMFWQSSGTTESSHKTIMGGRGNMKDMETTALAALAYIEAGYGGSDTNKILTYIVNQKDSRGAWGSTFATILSLKALNSALTGNSDVADAKIQVFVDDNLADTITIDKDNSDVLQLVDLKKYAKKGDTSVKLTKQGEGNLFYQIVGVYYLEWDDVKLPTAEMITIDLDYDKTKLAVNDEIKAKVNAVYHGEGFVDNAIIDLGIPPGFSVTSSELQKEVEKGTIEKYDVTGRQIIIYIRFLDQKGINIEYSLKAKYPIKAKTTKSSVYDYYNPDMRDEAESVEIEVT